jgi:predicted nuclease of predicted toxin-antitoxin system
VRILLDEHLSPRRVGGALRASGHDVKAVAEEADLSGLDDPAILAAAVEVGRILVTFNHRDFIPLLRELAEAGASHPGCIVVFGIKHDEIGVIVQSLVRLLANRPEPERWVDMVQALSRRP